MNNTNYERIKRMSLDEMTEFFTKLAETDPLLVADTYLCKKCKEEHDGQCSMTDGDTCPYERDNYETIKAWLSGEFEE